MSVADEATPGPVSGALVRGVGLVRREAQAGAAAQVVRVAAPARRPDLRVRDRGLPALLDPDQLVQAPAGDRGLGHALDPAAPLAALELHTRPHRRQPHLPHVVLELDLGRVLHDDHRRLPRGDRGVRVLALPLPRLPAGADLVPDRADVPGGDPDRPDLQHHPPPRPAQPEARARARLLHDGGAVLRLDAQGLLRHDPDLARGGGADRRADAVRDLLAHRDPAVAARASR